MYDLEPVLRKFVQTMSMLDIPYVIVGGFALAGWGRARATMDVDVIMQLNEADVPRTVKALREGGFSIKAEDITDALRRKEHFSIFNSDTIFHVDAKGVYGKKEARTLQSRITIRFSDYEMPISNLEDTIANKLRFGREQDLEDAVALMIANRASLKMDALQALCNDYGLLKELRALVRKAAIQEAEETGPDRHR
jgi:hypothetical protein